MMLPMFVNVPLITASVAVLTEGPQPVLPSVSVIVPLLVNPLATVNVESLLPPQGPALNKLMFSADPAWVVDAPLSVLLVVAFCAARTCTVPALFNAVLIVLLRREMVP